MLKNTLNSISPLDGRYATKLIELEQYFSEFALIKNRVIVEINWLIFMSRNKSLSFVPALSKNCLLYTSPSPRDGLLSRMPSSA